MEEMMIAKRRTRKRKKMGCQWKGYLRIKKCLHGGIS
jgi:hypothetical protein